MKKFIILILLPLFAINCSKVEDLQDDPNRPTAVSPELILTQIETTAFNTIELNAALATRYLTYTDGVDQYQYYNWTRAGFDEYDNLKQVQKMVEEAKRTDERVYQILGTFFSAYFTVELTQVFGDVPYSEATKATEDIFTPVYDSQEAIYKSVLDSLHSASLALAENDQPIRGDVVYNGNKVQWQKLINSYTLRVLMSLSEKTEKTGINVIAQFQEIVNNPVQYPIFESNDDSGALDFVDIQNNRYPLFNSNAVQTAYYMEKSFVQCLQQFDDPRLFAMAEKKPSAANAADGDFSAYGGLLGSATLSDNGAEALTGEASQLKPRYYADPINEPSLLMGYAELQFILAEAAARGWISAQASTFYYQGITASMQFYGIEDASAYLESPEVQLQDDTAIEQILTQKHIALFLNTGWQMFYEQRRTGFPELNVDGGGILNNGIIPKRFMYPQNETINNPENLKTAIERQFPDGDNINAEMWLIK